MHPPFACPVCRVPFSGGDGSLQCRSCGLEYRLDHGTPVLIAQQFIDSFKEIEQHFHDELSESAAGGSVKGRNSLFHKQFEKPMLDLPKGSAVLEVACGTRVDGIEVAESGKDVTSMDISPDAVRHALQLVAHAGPSLPLRFVVADAEHLPFTDKSFDATFVAASFHHFPDQKAALTEMKRVTKPGGYVIWGVEPASWPYKTVFRLLSPVKRFIRSRRDRTFNSIADDTTEGYTRTQIESLFDSCGLRVTSVRPVKLFTEWYDSGTRMTARLLKKDIRPNRTISHALARVDASLGMIPGVNKLFWHFNVISVVPQ